MGSQFNVIESGCRGWRSNDADMPNLSADLLRPHIHRIYCLAPKWAYFLSPKPGDEKYADLRQNTAHVEPLCRTPLRNNLPIELKSSLTIGSANRQSTLHVEAWVDLEMMVSQGKTGLHVEPASTWKSQQTSRENKQKATRGVGFGPDIYNKRSPLTRSQNRLQNPGFAAGRESPAGWSQPGSPN